MEKKSWDRKAWGRRERECNPELLEKSSPIKSLGVGLGMLLKGGSACLTFRHDGVVPPAILTSVYSFTTGQTEAESSEVQGHPGLHSKFDVSLGYMRLSEYSKPSGALPSIPTS